MNKEQVITHVQPTLRDESTVIAGYLFGSLAKGTENPMSDIDIAFLSSRRGAKTNAELTRRLTIQISEALDALAVDVVCLNGADLALRYNVIRDGLLFYEKNPARRISFEKRTLVEYFDMIPLWDKYDHQMALRLRGGQSS
jgi:hypothetical protein